MYKNGEKKVVALKRKIIGPKKRLIVAHIRKNLRDNNIYFVEIEKGNNFDELKSLGFSPESVKKTNKIKILQKKESMLIGDAIKLFNFIATDLVAYKNKLESERISVIETEVVKYVEPIRLSKKEQKSFKSLKKEGFSIKEIAKKMNKNEKGLLEYYYTNYKRYNSPNDKLSGINSRNVRLNKEKYPDIRPKVKSI